MVSLLAELNGGSSLIINNKNLCIVTPTGSNVTLVESSKWGKVVDAAVLNQTMLFVLLRSTKMALHAYSLDESECSITPRSKMSIGFGTHIVPLRGDFFAVTDYSSIETEMFEWRADSKTVRRCWVKRGSLPSAVGASHFSMIQLKGNMLEIRKVETGDVVASVNASNRNMPIVDASSAGKFVFVMYSSCVVTVFEFEGRSVKRLQDLGKLPDVGDKRHIITSENDDGTCSVWVKGATKMLVLKRVISESRGVPPFEKSCVARPCSQTIAAQPAITAAAPAKEEAQEDAQLLTSTTLEDELEEVIIPQSNVHAVVIAATIGVCVASVVTAMRWFK